MWFAVEYFHYDNGMQEAPNEPMWNQISSYVLGKVLLQSKTLDYFVETIDWFVL